MRISVGQGRWISPDLSSFCCCKWFFLQYTTLHKSILHSAMAHPYLFSLPARMGLISQLKNFLFCLCLLTVLSLFPSLFVFVFELNCVRVQFARLDVRKNKVALCYVLECFALELLSPFTAGGYRMLATDLRNSRIHPNAQKSFQKERQCTRLWRDGCLTKAWKSEPRQPKSFCLLS